MVMVWDPGQTKHPPGLVRLGMKWDRFATPSRWGEASPNFDRRIGVQRWGQKTVCEARLWVLNGTWAVVAEVDTQECMTFAAARWTGTHFMSLLCFAAIRWAIMCMRSLAFAISTALVCTIMVFAPWRASARLIWTMSIIALFGFLMFPFAISVTVLVARLVAISVSALGGL